MAAGQFLCFSEDKGGVESGVQGLRVLPGGLEQERGNEPTLQSCSYPARQESGLRTPVMKERPAVMWNFSRECLFFNQFRFSGTFIKMTKEKN